jgi:hypothetical protein
MVDARASKPAVREDQNTLTPELVARVVAGIPVIGEACDALRKD